MKSKRYLVAIAVSLATAGLYSSSVSTTAQSPASTTARRVIAASSSDDSGQLRETDSLIERMVRSGELRLIERREDPLVPGRMHERFQQLYRDLPVLGAEVVRQQRSGQMISAFGVVYEGLSLDIRPSLSLNDVATALRSRGLSAQTQNRAELVVLPTDAGAYVTAYKIQLNGDDGGSTAFVDTNDASVLLQLTNRQTQAAVGQGTGILGDTKKISTTSQAGTFVSQDSLRPPQLETYDLQGNVARLTAFLNGQTDLVSADLARRSDNIWVDGAVVDGHVYAGWVYDYYYKRFSRRGLDDNNVRIRGIVHPARASDYATASASTRSSFYLNAFYSTGCKCIVFGEGLPQGQTILVGNTQVGVRNFAAALDVVGHELTHAVTDASSRLAYRNESGALNESFSDMMGASIEFFYQPAGNGPLRSDYLLGEDLVTAPVTGLIRSLQAPADYGQPDHYGFREYIGATRDFDSGGVHSNSGISNQAFFFAIEGGTNRVSRRTVQGVGAANREQIEKVFYRAFTAMLPSSATFYLARVATLQSARDLYGVGSAAERSITQAWDAVGVTLPGAALATAFTPEPAPASNVACGGARPSFTFTTTVSEFQGVGFTVSGFDIYSYDSAQRGIGRESFDAATFREFFSDCGQGNTRIPPGGRACSRLCGDLGGRSSGYAIFVFSGADDNGNLGRFTSNAARLGASAARTDDGTYGPVRFAKAIQP